jgi:hypothetical protein
VSRTIGCIGYIHRPKFDFDFADDALQVGAMLEARDDAILMVHWDDLDAGLCTEQAWDVRRGEWTRADFGRCDALLILEAPAPGSKSANFARADAAMRMLRDRGMPSVNSVRSFLAYPDKRYVVERPDMPFPRTRLVTAADDVEPLLAGFGDTVVVKPLIGCGGKGVVRLPCSAEAVRAVLEPGREYLLQEYLPEIVDGERSLYFYAKRYRYAVIKRPHADEFRSNNAWGVAAPHEPTADELALATEAVARFGSPSTIERVDLCAGRVLEMTIECPGLKIALCGVERAVGHWTYEAIDLAIANEAARRG